MFSDIAWPFFPKILDGYSNIITAYQAFKMLSSHYQYLKYGYCERLKIFLIEKIEDLMLTKFSFQSIKTKYWSISKIIWRTQNNTCFPSMYTLHFRTRHPKKKKNNSNFSFNICFIKQGWNLYDGKIIMHCFKNIKW